MKLINYSVIFIHIYWYYRKYYSSFTFENIIISIYENNTWLLWTSIKIFIKPRIKHWFRCTSIATSSTATQFFYIWCREPTNLSLFTFNLLKRYKKSGCLYFSYNNITHFLSNSYMCFLKSPYSWKLC